MYRVRETSNVEGLNISFRKMSNVVGQPRRNFYAELEKAREVNDALLERVAKLRDLDEQERPSSPPLLHLKDLSTTSATLDRRLGRVQRLVGKLSADRHSTPKRRSRLEERIDELELELAKERAMRGRAEDELARIDRTAWLARRVENCVRPKRLARAFSTWRIRCVVHLARTQLCSAITDALEQKVRASIDNSSPCCNKTPLNLDSAYAVLDAALTPFDFSGLPA